MALTPSFFLFFFFSSVTLVCFTRAQGRAPHGLAHENPVAFSPSAVDFFHPRPQEPSGESPCAASPLPLPAQSVVVATDQARKISTSQKGGDHRLRAGGAAGFVLGVAFAVLMTVAVYHLMVTRKANSNRPNGC
uniref:Transmembrane protein n=1 Tax=Salix viminalis TaxID=40686 RepID=A0A6N2LC08_SALVM